MAGSGWCTHPKRQEASAVRLLVRRGELACRNSWGGDLFSSKHGDDEFRDERAIDPRSPTDSPRPGPVDDQVTSVVTPPARRSPNDGSTKARPDNDSDDEDRVVSDRPAPRQDNQREEPDNLNDAARNDQDERARLIARGNSDALAHARERLFDRKRRLRTSEPDPEHSATPDADDEVTATRTSTFTPSGHTPVSPRQPRYVQRIGKKETVTAEAFPDDSPVPRAEVLRRQGDRPSPDRFESIPEVDPDFDLPGWRHAGVPKQNELTSDRQARHQQIEPQSAIPEHSDPPDEAKEPPESAFEHTLNRARRIRGTKRASRPHAVRVDDQGSIHEADISFRGSSSAQRTSTDVDHGDPVYPPDMDEPYHPAHGYSNETSTRLPARVQPSAPQSRKRGWLAQFGIRHNTGSDGARTADPKGLTSGPDAILMEDGVSGRSDATNQHDRSHDVKDSGYALDQSIEPVAADSEVVSDSDVTDIPKPADAEHWAGTYPDLLGSEEPGYVLPDLDDVFAEPTHTNLDERTSRAHDRSTPRPPDIHSYRPAPDMLAGERFSEHSPPDVTQRSAHHIDAPADNDFHHGSFNPDSRWSRESTSSPRESWFRARRFREWEQSQDPDRHEHRMSARSNSHDVDVGPAAGHRTPSDHHSLPDLDAHDFDLRDIVERGGELLDMTIEIAPDVPRSCRSCRSFQSADGGVRGWCTNEWAFTHRRMVNEDDLACDTTIGCWWLPDDRYWHSDPPVSWSSATPLVDAFMARRTLAPRRKTSGE